MSESRTTSSATVEPWFENVGDMIEIVVGIVAAAIFIWMVVRIVNDRPNLKAKGLPFWMAAGMLAVAAISLAALSAILWLG